MTTLFYSYTALNRRLIKLRQLILLQFTFLKFTQYGKIDRTNSNFFTISYSYYYTHSNICLCIYINAYQNTLDRGVTSFSSDSLIVYAQTQDSIISASTV